VQKKKFLWGDTCEVFEKFLTATTALSCGQEHGCVKIEDGTVENREGQGKGAVA